MSIRNTVKVAFVKIADEEKLNYDTNLFCNLVISDYASKGTVVKFTSVERRLREEKEIFKSKAIHAQMLQNQLS